MSLSQKLRDMHEIAADSCDPEFNRALLDAANRIDELAVALKPFAYYYDLNDCKERDRRGALEVPISDLAEAKRALGEAPR